MYKIFINEYPLVITDNEQDFFEGGNYRMVDDTPEAIATAIETLEKSVKLSAPFGLMVMCEDANRTFAAFSKPYEKITAAGGLVYNEKAELLLILRQGKWDLPKGKVDEGETIPEAAVREVQEECSIDRIQLGPLLTQTFHTYILDNRKVLKTTHWYRMLAKDYRRMSPQLEENITELKWFNPEELDLQSLDTYNSIRELLRENR